MQTKRSWLGRAVCAAVACGGFPRVRLICIVGVLAGLLPCFSRPCAAQQVILPGIWHDVDKYHLDSEPEEGASWTHNWYGDDFNNVWGLNRWDYGEPVAEEEDPAWAGQGYIARYVDDKSCWIATAANMLLYMGRPNYYHQWAYVTGVNGDWYGGDLENWTHGGNMHFALEDKDYDPIYRTSDDAWGVDPNVVWENNPIPFVVTRIGYGLPVGLSIAWNSGGRHAFTLYAIDTDAQTITFACSDSDRGGTDFVTRHYTWGDNRWAVDYKGDGNYHHLVGATSFRLKEWLGTGLGNWGDLFSWGMPVAGLPSGKDAVLIEFADTGRLEVTTEAVAMKAIIKGPPSLLRVTPSGRLHVDSLLTLDGGQVFVDGGELRTSGQLVSEGLVTVANDGLVRCNSSAFIGGAGEGEFRTTQGGAFEVVLDLTLGQYAGSSGTLTLDDFYARTGSVYVGRHEYVGDRGQGYVVQQAGAHTVAGDLYLGRQSGSHGEYHMTGGDLEVLNLYVGGDGFGQYLHSGDGYVNVADTLQVGGSGPFGGAYELAGRGFVETAVLKIGGAGSGSVLEHDGEWNSTCAVKNILSIGNGGEGTYILRGGLLDATGSVDGIVVADTHRGTLEIHGGQVASSRIAVGSSWAPGVVHQSGGEVVVQGPVSLTGIAGGEYTIDKGLLWADVLRLAEARNTRAEFIHNDGTVRVNVSANVGRYGTAIYTMVAGLLDVAETLGISPLDHNGDGTFNLDGGTVVADKIVLGSNGTLNLSGGTLRLNNLEALEDFDLLSCSLHLGHAGGSGAGSHRIDRDSVLQVRGDLVIGYNAPATFDHVGGDVVVGGQATIGAAAGGEGAYTLWDGRLQAERLDIGNSAGTGGGNFSWLGGRLDVEDVRVHAGGNMEVEVPWQVGGELTIHGGEFEVTSTDHLLVEAANGGSGCLALVDGAMWANTLTAGESGPGSFAQYAGLATVRSHFVLGEREDGHGLGEMRGGELVVRGSMQVGVEGWGLFQQNDGMVRVHQDLSLGQEHTSEGVYELLGGALAVSGKIYVGDAGIGRLVYGGGSYSAEEIVIGRWGSFEAPEQEEPVVLRERITFSGGKMLLDTRELIFDGPRAEAMITSDYDAKLQSRIQCFGDLEPGRMRQFGGENRVTQALVLGRETTGHGEYDLEGRGLLEALGVVIGGAGSGILRHTGGTHQVADQLVLGGFATGSGEYHLQGNAILTAPCVTVGQQGSGLVHQTGGVHHVAETLTLGGERNSSGRYRMDGGELVAHTLRIGHQGAGRLEILSPDTLITIEQALHFGLQSEYAAVAGATVHMTGSALVNQSKNPAALAGLLYTTLIFEGGTTVWDPFEVAGKDHGPLFAGFRDNFALGELVLGGDAGVGWLILVDTFLNSVPREGAEALYVDNLIIGSRSRLDLNGMNLYYGNAFIAADANILLNGGILAHVASMPGDANRDGRVDLDDFVICKRHFGAVTGATWAMGDFNGDRSTNLEDFVILKRSFGTAVPEPAALTLLALGGLALSRRRQPALTLSPLRLVWA